MRSLQTEAEKERFRFQLKLYQIAQRGYRRTGAYPPAALRQFEDKLLAGQGYGGGSETLNIELKPCSPRYVIRFNSEMTALQQLMKTSKVGHGSNGGRGLERDGGIGVSASGKLGRIKKDETGSKSPVKLQIFKHVEGSRALDGIIPTYDLPDGTAVRFYAKVNVHEADAPSMPVTDPPIKLTSVLQEVIPMPDGSTLSPSSLERIPLRSVAGYRPDVRDGGEILDTAQITFYVDTSEHHHELHREGRPPIEPQIFLLRKATAKSESLYDWAFDTKDAFAKTFEKNWNACAFRQFSARPAEWFRGFKHKVKIQDSHALRRKTALSDV